MTVTPDLLQVLNAGMLPHPIAPRINISHPAIVRSKGDLWNVKLEMITFTPVLRRRTWDLTDMQHRNDYCRLTVNDIRAVFTSWMIQRIKKGTLCNEKHCIKRFWFESFKYIFGISARTESTYFYPIYTDTQPQWDFSWVATNVSRTMRYPFYQSCIIPATQVQEV